MKKGNAVKVDYIQVEQNTLPNGGTIRFFCPVDGPTLDEVMAKVYKLAAQSLIRRHTT